jgi:hypothetical protein
MIEMRWRDAGDGSPRILQYRLAVTVDASGAFCPGPPGEWIDVPPSTRTLHEMQNVDKVGVSFCWIWPEQIEAYKSHNWTKTGKTREVPIR